MSKHNTLHYLIALLKAYGIKNIVASPGTQNSTNLMRKSGENLYGNIQSKEDLHRNFYSAVKGLH